MLASDWTLLTGWVVMRAHAAVCALDSHCTTSLQVVEQPGAGWRFVTASRALGVCMLAQQSSCVHIPTAVLAPPRDKGYCGKPQCARKGSFLNGHILACMPAYACPWAHRRCPVPALGV